MNLMNESSHYSTPTTTEQLLQLEQLAQQLEAKNLETEQLQVTIRQLQSYNDKLSSESQSLTEKIEMLLQSDMQLKKLDEQLKKQKDDNKQLLSKQKDLQAEISRLQDENRKLTTNIQDLTNKYNNLITSKVALPDLENYRKQLSELTAGAQKEVNALAGEASAIRKPILKLVYIMAVTCFLLCFFSYRAVRENNEILAQVETDYNMIYNSLYNKAGFAVLNGTVYSEQLMKTTDPARYKYLKDKEEGKMPEQPAEKSFFKRLFGL